MTDEVRPSVCVKFTRVGRVHILPLPEPPPDPPLAVGEDVLVQTAAGPMYATVVPSVPAIVARRDIPSDPAQRLIGRVPADERASRRRQQDLERRAFQFCALRISERGLPMKLTRVEQLADGSRLTFYFTAESRVDFRELVRDLAAEFRTRIELRQIGVRDEARMLGGYGSCGRPLCCTTWLQKFEPVSIKMAKQQKLSLNPAKLSGLCGRLKCCLRYELDGTAGAGSRADRDEDALPEGSQGEGGCATGGGSCGCRPRPR